FVENVLALSRLVRAGVTDFDAFRAELTNMRYRGGELAGYPSRLHYFSDWIADNERKGLVRDITRELGGVVDPEPIRFMSTHVDAYRQLSDPANLEAIRRIEAVLSERPRYYIPEDRIAEVAPRIRNGDIIAATSTLEGLDIAHTGVALWKDGELHLLHAPLVGRDQRGAAGRGHQADRKAGRHHGGAAAVARVAAGGRVRGARPAGRGPRPLGTSTPLSRYITRAPGPLRRLSCRRGKKAARDAARRARRAGAAPPRGSGRCRTPGSAAARFSGPPPPEFAAGQGCSPHSRAGAPPLGRRQGARTQRKRGFKHHPYDVRTAPRRPCRGRTRP